MNANAIAEWISLALVIIGTAITFIASIGVIRLPDVYNRAHATTKTATLGILAILLGAFIYFWFVHNIVSIRLLLGIFFVFLTAPVAGHMIIRSAHRSGVPLAAISVQDDLQEDLERAKRKAAKAAGKADGETSGDASSGDASDGAAEPVTGEAAAEADGGPGAEKD